MSDLNKLSELQNTALGHIEDKLHYVVRFRGNKHITTRNSVQEHIEGLFDLIDKLIPDKTSPALYELSESLKLSALLHDMGEILGEVSTLEEVINQEAIRDGLKKEFEFKVFKVFTRLAIKAVRQNKPEIFELTYQSFIDDTLFPLKLTRKLINKLDSILAITDLDSECDCEYLKLEELYYQVENGKSLGNKIFKLIDKLEGNKYFINNAVLQDQLSTSKFEEVHRMNTILFQEIDNVKLIPNITPEISTEEDIQHIVDLKFRLRNEMDQVFSEYESILKSNNLKIPILPTIYGTSANQHNLIVVD